MNFRVLNLYVLYLQYSNCTPYLKKAEIPKAQAFSEWGAGASKNGGEAANFCE